MKKSQIHPIHSLAHTAINVQRSSRASLRQLARLVEERASTRTMRRDRVILRKASMSDLHSIDETDSSLLLHYLARTI